MGHSEIGAELGRRVESRMRESGLTQRELGKRLQMGHSQISRRLSGETAWRDEDVVAIGKALGVGSDELAAWKVLARRSRGDRWANGSAVAEQEGPVKLPAPRAGWKRSDAEPTAGDENELIVRSSAMAPELADGDHVFIEPVDADADLRDLVGRLVVVQHQGQYTIGRLGVATSDGIVILAVDPAAGTRRIGLADVSQISLIVESHRTYASC